MKKILIIIITILSFANANGQLPLQIGDAVITGRINPLAVPPVNAVLYVLRAGNTSTVPMNDDVWTTIYPTSNPKPSYTTWDYNTLGSVFGITIDDFKRIYVANTKMFSDINPSKKSSIYMINGGSSSTAVTVVASALVSSSAYMPQLTGEFGNLKFVRMGGIGYIYVSDFGAKKIHCLEQGTTGILTYKFSFDPVFNNLPIGNSDGQTPYGLAIRKVAAGYKLYYARMGKGLAWSEGVNSIYGSNDNEIWAVDIDAATGSFLTGTEVKQNLPTDILQNPFADIDFNYNYKKMLCGQQGITSGSSGSIWPSGTMGAHQSRIYEFEEISPNNWGYSSGTPTTGIKFESGNTSMSSYAAGKNAIGGVSYGHNILGKNNQFKCDTSVWFTSDIIYVSGIPSGGVPTLPAPKAPVPNNHVIYGVQAMHSSGGALGTQKTALNFDLDNIIEYQNGTSPITNFYPYGVSSKGKVGDIEMVNAPDCPTIFEDCTCSQTIIPTIYWDKNGATDSLKLNCGGTYTNIFDCYKAYTFKINNPCSGQCQPDSSIISVSFNGSAPLFIYNTLSLPINISSPFGTAVLTIKTKCNGVWCKECKITIVQNKNCEPPCTNCTINNQPKVNALFVSNQSLTTASVYPNTTTVNAMFNISGGTDTYTEIRANVIDFSITSDNPACLQCYNTPNQWGSVLNGSLTNYTPNIISYGGIAASNANNNPREIVFTRNVPAILGNPSQLSLNFNLPGATPLSCCCLDITMYVKFTFRNNKCEECTKFVKLKMRICYENGKATLTFENNNQKSNELRFHKIDK
jgi:hypothetical protein